MRKQEKKIQRLKQELKQVFDDKQDLGRKYKEQYEENQILIA